MFAFWDLYNVCLHVLYCALCLFCLDQFMITDHQYISRKDDRDKVIIFEKGDLVFVFNFHWQKSFTDYRVGCIKPGEYRVHVEKTKDLNML